uniref:Pectinesterase n=1 Tax=Panagrellus redivivus TaxID=6233 RepID=A0A7E4ZYM9_PANRE
MPKSSSSIDPTTSPAATTLILVFHLSRVLPPSIFRQLPTMPYLILTLPYPFAKRLPQLLNPVELRNLQIAAGHSEGSLKPIVLTCNVYIASFNGNTSDFISVGQQKVVKIHNNKVFCKCEYAFFIALSEVVVENYYFNNTHYAANVVTFKHCKVSTKFLENVAHKLTELTELYFENKCESAWDKEN